MQDLRGQVAFITGAARGLGQSIAERLARDGVRIVGVDQRSTLLEETMGGLRATGTEALAVPTDICDWNSLERALAKAQDSFGAVNIVINNAGTDVTAPIEELTPEQFERIIKTNLTAPFVLSKLAFGMMTGAGGGQIVNIVSTAAKRAWDSASAYHASKWGLLGLSHALHVEGRRKNIRVGAVISGGLKTPFLLERFPDIDPQLLQEPANVAEAVRFMLTMPPESAIPEIMVIPTHETSWP